MSIEDGARDTPTFLGLMDYLSRLAGREVKWKEGEGFDITLPLGFYLDPRNPEGPVEIEHPLAKEYWQEGGHVYINFDREVYTRSLLFPPPSYPYTVVIDYSSPNIAKPMHVGHLRSTVIGESLKRIYKFFGGKVVGLNFLGDIGTQFGSLIVAYRKWVDEGKLLEDPIRELLRIYVKFHEEVEKNPSLEEEAKRELKKLEEGDSSNLELWKRFRELSIKGFQKVYDILGVEFDVITGESEFVDMARKVVEELLEKGIARVEEEGKKKGSVVVDLGGELDTPVLMKSDGTTLYLSRDLASLLWRYERWKPDYLIYVVAREQRLHFKQLFALARRLGIPSNLVHVSFGMIHLKEGKMSTRKGRVVFLEDVIKELEKHVVMEMEKRGTDTSEATKLTVNALVYWILKYEPDKDVVFDYSKVSEFRGETGVYTSYAYVRAKHVYERGGSGELGIPSEEEWPVVKKLGMFHYFARESMRKNTPHYLARYLYDLSSEYHRFYDSHRIIGSSRESFRLWMNERVLETTGKAMELLAMKKVERM